MSEKMRDSFEDWVKSFVGESWLTKDKLRVGEYGDDSTQFMWDAWQASRAALVVELPSLENGLIHPFDGPSMIVDAVAKQLDAAGVSYK